MNAPTSAQSRRAVITAVIGNMLEWYDFAVYAYVAAIIDGRHLVAEGNRLRRAGVTN